MCSQSQETEGWEGGEREEGREGNEGRKRNENEGEREEINQWASSSRRLSLTPLPQVNLLEFTFSLADCDSLVKATLGYS